MERAQAQPGWAPAPRLSRQLRSPVDVELNDYTRAICLARIANARRAQPDKLGAELDDRVPCPGCGCCPQGGSERGLDGVDRLAGIAPGLPHGIDFDRDGRIRTPRFPRVFNRYEGLCHGGGVSNPAGDASFSALRDNR